MTDIPKQYQPRDVQSKWYRVWEERGDFHADIRPGKPPHAIMIPLPNVTGALHMGHALNGTLQDLLTRWRRMQGDEALWMPGTDHAGIATQAVVERRMLEEEGLTRHDVGREAMVNRIWRWKDAYEERILNQLKQIGAGPDWRRTRFTLDEVCSRAVMRTFFKLFKDGLIYRGKRLVNWDTYLQTAVSDDEIFHDEVEGHFWTFTYPVVDGGETIAFSTTRPETLLGDTAVAVHPEDERYRHLIGRKVRIPLLDREIPVIGDAILADPELGTGAVKVTPAHDPNDYECGLRNDLPMINILNPDGTLNENAGPYAEMTISEARERVIEDMKAAGHFVEVAERMIDLAHSDRSKTPIEPYLSDQWFVKMGDHEDGRPGLAQMAMDAVEDGRVRFFPSRYAKTYLDWLGEKRDWCISRQLWWGHRIPVWSKTVVPPGPKDPSVKSFVEHLLVPEEHADYVSATFEDGPTPDEKLMLVCVDYGHEEMERQLEEEGFQQDPDVLDTWFSSALWPHSTLGWPDPQRLAEEADNPDEASLWVQDGTTALDYFYPTSVLVTSRDIITLWVARMVLAGLYNMGEIPFHHVHVHPKILDGFGQTMSKSKGNGVDPMDLIDKYGTDAVRFTIASFAGETQDVRLPVGYECPECGNVIPQELEHQQARPQNGQKPRVKCPKCKKSWQYTSPNFDPDPDESVARVVSDRFEYGRNFCNKLWNASRFALINLEGYTPGPIPQDGLTLEDRWILSRLSTVAAEVTTRLNRYQFDAATRILREFTWNEFCDWYVEMIKPRLRDDDSTQTDGSAVGDPIQTDGSAVGPGAEGAALEGTSRSVAQRMLVGVLDALLRLLQPFTPYICEELWQRLNEIAPERGLPQPDRAAESIVLAPWPEFPTDWRDRSLETRFERLQEVIAAVRNVRAVYGIPPSTPLKLYMRCGRDLAGEMQDVAGQFDNLARTMLQAAGAEVERPKGSAGFALPEAEGFIPLEGVIDRNEELQRQKKQADKLQGLIAGQEKKLANPNFVEKAPRQVVEQVRETRDNLQNQLESTERIIEELSED